MGEVRGWLGSRNGQWRWRGAGEGSWRTKGRREADPSATWGHPRTIHIPQHGPPRASTGSRLFGGDLGLTPSGPPLIHGPNFWFLLHAIRRGRDTWSPNMYLNSAPRLSQVPEEGLGLVRMYQALLVMIIPERASLECSTCAFILCATPNLHSLKIHLENFPFVYHIL